MAAALVAAALVAVALPAAARASAFSVSVSRRPVTRPLPANFLGLALEYSTVPDWTGDRSRPSNAVLGRLVHNLDPSGRPLVRIGGQSADRSWWPVPGMKRPIGVTHTLGPAWTRSALQFARQTNARLMLGLNMEAGRTRIAQKEAFQFVRRIGGRYIANWQIGNEPDLYRVTPWYRMQGRRVLPWYAKTGRDMYSRGPSWGPGAFVAQFRAMVAGLPRLPLVGPETSSPPFMSTFAHGMLSPHSRVRMLTTHAYGLDNCDTDPASPRYPTVPNLLGLRASRHLGAGEQSELALAHRDGAQLRIDEMGSITCNGHPHVSDTFASALWVMDALFYAARTHVDGVNLHSYPHSLNGLFDFSYRRSAKRWQAVVHPLYYGALMFADAAPAGSRVLHIASASQQQTRAWATLAPDHRVRVLLINDSTSATTRARVRAPTGYARTSGSLERLRAPSAYAEGRVTLGGRRFGVTQTGVLRAPALSPARPRGGAYTVTLPPASAALLTLKPPSNDVMRSATSFDDASTLSSQRPISSGTCAVRGMPSRVAPLSIIASACAALRIPPEAFTPRPVPATSAAIRATAAAPAPPAG